jgi:tetraacyldisaccharide 4'-kinase
MAFWQILLFPFAILYDFITRVRNWLYDRQLLKSHHFDGLFVVSVGNLTVGGTGKTPFVEYLIRYGFGQGWRIATLSRGYGRETRGFRVAGKEDTAATMGDEVIGYFRQFGDQIKVTVGENRADAIRQIQKMFPQVNVIILDDAFQHRSVRPDVSILLTTQKRPFFTDYVLPAGRLRESMGGFHRADFLMATKCSHGIEEMHTQMERFNKPMAFTSVKYGALVKMGILSNKIKVVAVAGIADASDFFAQLDKTYRVVHTEEFPDHHDYTQQEVWEFVELVTRHNAMLITTFKDAVKLEQFVAMKSITWGYLPIEIEFMHGEPEMKQLLEQRFKEVTMSRTSG